MTWRDRWSIKDRAEFDKAWDEWNAKQDDRWFYDLSSDRELTFMELLAGILAGLTVVALVSYAILRSQG